MSTDITGLFALSPLLQPALCLQIEEEQNAMQARLEEEEANKAALVERINRLTRLILVSTQDVRDGSATPRVNCSTLISSKCRLPHNRRCAFLDVEQPLFLSICSGLCSRCTLQMKQLSKC